MTFNNPLKLGLDITLLLLAGLHLVTSESQLERVALLRRKRGSLTCPSDIYRTASPGRTCAVVSWHEPSGSNGHSGGDPWDCFSEGDHTIKYTYHGIASWHWISGDSCSFQIHVTVLRCSSPHSISHGSHHCSGPSSTLNGAVCSYSCSRGYTLQGPSRVECKEPYSSASYVTWDHSFPSCQVSCTPVPTLPHGTRHCNGNPTNVYRSVCSHSCNTGYKLVGSNDVTCRNSPLSSSPDHKGTWSDHFPSCQESCSWPRNHCWPGDCSQDLAKNCICRPGFRLNTQHGKRCDLNTAPEMNTCQVSVIDAGNYEKASGYTSNLTDCSHQRDEIINTQPSKLKFKIGALLDLDVGNISSSYSFRIRKSEVGVIDTKVTVVRIALNGIETEVTSQHFNNTQHCNEDVDSLHPYNRRQLFECEATMNLTVTLKNGERLCADMESFSGGFYQLQNERRQLVGSPEVFSPVSAKKRVCFLYDNAKPTHCSETGCNSEPLRLSTRLTRHPIIAVSVEGWADPIPLGGNLSSAAGIHCYKLEVHDVLTDSSPLAVESTERQGLTHQWDAMTSPNGSHDLTLTLPPENPRLYAVVLEVHDNAGDHGNVAYARRFVLYDNSSTVAVRGTLTVDSASPEAQYLWQTDIQHQLCVNWIGRFYNQYLKNTFLKPIKPDLAKDITGHYEQNSGVLPVSGTDNVDGILHFEMSWRRAGEVQRPYVDIADVHTQRTCLSEALRDGQTYTVWIRATDIMNNTQTASTTVHVDHSGPQVTVHGLQGRLSTEGLFIHDSTDLSTITLDLHVSDPHSGIHTIQLAVGTAYLANDVAQKSVAVQELRNVTNCTSQSHCYCPSVGPCENPDYTLNFNSIVNANNKQGFHHREYYITVNITNKARLRTTEVIDILIDASPPSGGVVLEGLTDDDKAEMDFTSDNSAHLRWHGFKDEESGIRLYRVDLAERCMTLEEMERSDNVTEIMGANSVILSFPKEGHYITSVVAYNGAMQPSPVACSDGITFDTTPPELLNVSLDNARTGRAIACTPSNEIWLINTDVTKTRLSPTTSCLSVCSAVSSNLSVDHLPISTNVSLEEELSDDLCQRLSIMNKDHTLLLPSDYLTLKWVGLDEESDMEDYFVGMGRDRTTSTAPDLLAFTPTHGHHSYRARHTGLGHGARFFVFLKAVNKAGLSKLLTFGPVIIDVTPPDVTAPLKANVIDGYITVTWNNHTFSDPEQPDSVDFEITFRVGHEQGFVTPVFAVPRSSLLHCLHDDVIGCVRYPISALQSYDSPQGRLFFIQLHVTNAAGHMTPVNSSGVRLPSKLPPSHGVVIDVIRLATSESVITALQTSRTGSTSSAPVTPSFAGVNATGSNVTLPHQNTVTLLSSSVTPPKFVTPAFSKDVDVIHRREEICIAWSGFLHIEDVTIEVGVGSSKDQDDVVQFTSVDNESPACLNASTLPVYKQLFSVVKATSSGGASVFSSDGFQLIPTHDTNNLIKIFNGKGCTNNDVIGAVELQPTDTTIDLSEHIDIPVHPGDSLFIRVSPFNPNITFPDSVVVQTSLKGYQLVAKSSNLTVNLPPTVLVNTTVEIMNCLLDAFLLPVSSTGFDVSIETSGQWTGLMKEKRIEVMDETCLKRSVKKSKQAHFQCLAGRAIVPSLSNTTTVKGNVYPGHFYTTSISPCFDDGCLPSTSSQVVTYDSTQRTIVFIQARITSQTSQGIDLQVNTEVQPAIVDLSGQSPPCIFKWSVSRDIYGSRTIIDWRVARARSCSDMQIQEEVEHPELNTGTVYICLHLLYPEKTVLAACHSLYRPRTLDTSSGFHVIELDHETLLTMDTTLFLHSQHLGSRLHQLYDLDVDVVDSHTVLSALVTDGDQRNITWFLMTNQRPALDGDCVADAECVMSKSSDTGTVVFSSAQFTLLDGQSYYVCAMISPRASSQHQSYSPPTLSEVCGNGFTVDNSPPVPGSVTISNTESGYLSDSEHVMVMWEGFLNGDSPGVDGRENTLNYSVALGSFPGSEDIAHYVSVGQRTTWTFDHLAPTLGVTCIATVRAEDRLGRTAETSSKQVIIDNTAPVLGYVTAGTVTQEGFVSGEELSLHWDSVEDRQSGIESTEVGVLNDGGQVVIPFQHVQGQSAVLTSPDQLSDGHSYIVVLKATNHAGLSAVKSSKPFIVDSTPPSPGVVWNSGSNSSTQETFSQEVGSYPVTWSGFTDPHSGLAYFRVGLGSSPGHVDIHPFLYVGLQTSCVWKQEFDQGRKYYVTVEACNHAGLCRVTSSSSMTFDNSAPLPGHVTVGFDGGHSKFLGHNDTLPVQWIGFADPQTHIVDFQWCVGKTPRSCDVLPVTHTVLSQGSLRSGLALPEATPLYVTVRARNAGGMETVSVSDSFRVDTTPPEIITKPYFVSPRDGSKIFSQWERSVLHLAWEFRDPESSVVTQSINILSKLTGRLLTDTIHVTADTELTIVLNAEELLDDGDSHRAAVTACNAAGLCSTSVSDFLLTDSTPPVAATFLSPLTWTYSHGTSRTVLSLVWNAFHDAESGILAYHIMVGTTYNGVDLSDGVVRVPHNNATKTQSHDLEISQSLLSGDVVYLSIKADNPLGLSSALVHMDYSVEVDSSSNTAGSLVLIRYSCKAAYCTRECSCSQVCSTSTPCPQQQTPDPALANLPLAVHLGFPSAPQAYSTSIKCLEGHWKLTNPAWLQNVSRFEWSYGLFNTSDGLLWRDVGLDTDIVHCLPGNEVLESGLKYVLHVRVWLSYDTYLNFTSDPVIIDHTPPSPRKRRGVIESDSSCGKDVDYITTEPNFTACWGGVFRDSDSSIARYEVWVGTSPYGSDFIHKIDKGLNTNLTISTRGMEQGTRYYVTVRAWNKAGLQTTLVSDGVIIDVTPPVTGTVFPSRRYGNPHAQSSLTGLPASWYGFEDEHSGLTSYHVALFDVDDVTTPIVPFTAAGRATQFLFQNLKLQHGHRYHVTVKARDKAGLWSASVNSANILVDSSSPEGVSCRSFSLQAQTTLHHTPATSFQMDSYHGKLQVSPGSDTSLMKLELHALNLEEGAGGYFQIEEMRMPVYFKYSQSGEATAVHEFVSPERTNMTVNVVIEGNGGSQVTAMLYGCNETEGDEKAVTVQQLSENIISVCARVLDRESGIRSLKIGLGSTEGGLQVQSFTAVGHGGHFQFTTHVQHATPLYASVIAENYASQWSRLISQPIVMDRTEPEVSDVKVTLRYEGEGQSVTLGVWVEAEWSAKDEQSHMMSCICLLVGDLTHSGAQQITYDVRPGQCRWLLEDPRHRQVVTVTVTCANQVDMHTSVTSDPVTVLLHPPDLSLMDIVPVSNSHTMSPYEMPDPNVLSSNSSLELHWRGLSDPTVTGVSYRFLHDLQPLTEWCQVPVLKTSAVLERGRSAGIPDGDLTLQVQAYNERDMASNVSMSVTVDDSKPTLTGAPAPVKQTPSEVQLDWRNTFRSHGDVTYSVFAGTAEAYGDVINHVTTKATSVSVSYTKMLSELFVIIQAVDRNGLSAVYQTQVQL